LKKIVIDEIYEVLNRIGLVSSEGEFCQGWLGHSDSYLRTLRYKNTEPSIGSIAICGIRLQSIGERMIVSTHHKSLGATFLGLSEKCQKLVNENAVELELIG
jgi:hypothetical protein